MAAPNRTHAHRWCKSTITDVVYRKAKLNPHVYGFTKAPTKNQVRRLINCWWEIAESLLLGNYSGIHGENPEHHMEARFFVKGIGEFGRRWSNGGRSVDGLDGRSRKVMPAGWSYYLKPDAQAIDLLSEIPLDPPVPPEDYPDSVVVTPSSGSNHQWLAGTYDKISDVRYERADGQAMTLNASPVGHPRWWIDFYRGPGDGSPTGVFLEDHGEGFQGGPRYGPEHMTVVEAP